MKTRHPQRNRKSKRKSLEEISKIVQERDRQGFHLPEGFDPGLDPDEAAQVVGEIETLDAGMARRGFAFILPDHLPIKIRYQFARYIANVTKGIEMPKGHFYAIGGCAFVCFCCTMSRWCEWSGAGRHVAAGFDSSQVAH